MRVIYALVCSKFTMARYKRESCHNVPLQERFVAFFSMMNSILNEVVKVVLKRPRQLFISKEIFVKKLL